MTTPAPLPLTKPDITVDAVVERTPSGRAWDAFVLVCNMRTGEYTKRGKVFRDRNSASRWLRRQSAQVAA